MNFHKMKKQIRIVKREEDESNLNYWVSLTVIERMRQLEEIRQQVNQRFYGDRQEFQRVYQVVKRA